MSKVLSSLYHTVFHCSFISNFNKSLYILAGTRPSSVHNFISNSILLSYIIFIYLFIYGYAFNVACWVLFFILLFDTYLPFVFLVSFLVCLQNMKMFAIHFVYHLIFSEQLLNIFLNGLAAFQPNGN